MAKQPHTTFTPLSHLFRDPVLRAVFERAERDSGQAFAVPSDPRKPIRPNAAAAQVREAAHVFA